MKWAQNDGRRRRIDSCLGDPWLQNKYLQSYYQKVSLPLTNLMLLSSSSYYYLCYLLVLSSHVVVVHQAVVRVERLGRLTNELAKCDFRKCDM